MSLRLALDFDGTLVEQGDPLRFRMGAREAILAFKKAGHRLILHSARCTPTDPVPEDPAAVERFFAFGQVPDDVTAQWTRFTEMRNFLQLTGMWRYFDEVWQAPGKPHADLFIDDLAEAPEWLTLIREFGVG